jgi:hypothetical protein
LAQVRQVRDSTRATRTEANVPERATAVEAPIETSGDGVIYVSDGVRVAAEALGYIDVGRLDLARDVLQRFLSAARRDAACCSSFAAALPVTRVLP